MNNQSVIAIFVVAAAAAVSGFFYFGSALNQQASAGNLLEKRITIPPSVVPVDPVNTISEIKTTPGISTVLVSTEAVKTQVKAGDNNDEVTFKVVFNVTNNSDQDMFLDKTCTSLSRKLNILGTKDLTFVVEDTNRIIPLKLITTCSVISDHAIVFPKSLKVSKDSSELITVVVSAKPAATGSYRMRIAGVGYNTTSGDIEGNQLLSAKATVLPLLATEYIFAN